MRVPVKWLREFVPFTIEVEELAGRLTMAGLEVESVEQLGRDLAGVVVGKTLAVEPHPNAGHLKVARVDIGRQHLSIVCGAHNVAPGQNVPVALPGSRLPMGLKVSETPIRGVVSQGMICSAFELGLDDKENREAGILVLDGAVRPGQDLIEALDLDEVVLELGLTPNYASHCQSILGVAREVAALTGDHLRLPDLKVEEDGDIEGRVRIIIQEPELCPRYTARMMTDLRIGPSPVWMQVRLRAVGLRPINNVVDVTNYVMIELGQPTHAFDYDLLEERTILVRRAREGEKIVTLDEVERTLSENDLVIADPARAVGIAGIMGAHNTEISEATRTLLLESANFNPQGILRTSRRMGLRTEASNRFEKGADPEGTARATDRIMQLLAGMGAGRVLRGRVDEYPNPQRRRKIMARPGRINRLIGTDLTAGEMASLLKRYGLKIDTEANEPEVSGEKEMRLIVEVPSWRPDLELEVDLAEEVARLYGYENIPTTMPFGVMTSAGASPRDRLFRRIRTLLAGAGLTEVIMPSFTNPRVHAKSRVPIEGGVDLVPLANPMSEEHSHLRASLIPPMLETLAYNISRKNENLALFELGKVYRPHQVPLRELPDELWTLVGGSLGEVVPRTWAGPGRPAGFFFMKGILEDLLVRLGISTYEFRRSQHPTLHPGRTASILLGSDEEQVGVLGDLHPEVAEAFDLPGRACIFELDCGVLETHVQPIEVEGGVPRFPAVTRDLSLIVSKEVEAREVEGIIQKAAGDLLEEVTLFDVYEGRPVPSGKRSLAYSLVYRSRERTLKDAEVDEVHGRVRRALIQRVDAELRS